MLQAQLRSGLGQLESEGTLALPYIHSQFRPARGGGNTPKQSRECCERYTEQDRLPQTPPERRRLVRTGAA